MTKQYVCDYEPCSRVMPAEVVKDDEGNDYCSTLCRDLAAALAPPSTPHRTS